MLHMSFMVLLTLVVVPFIIFAPSSPAKRQGKYQQGKLQKKGESDSKIERALKLAIIVLICLTIMFVKFVELVGK